MPARCTRVRPRRATSDTAQREIRPRAGRRRVTVRDSLSTWRSESGRRCMIGDKGTASRVGAPSFGALAVVVFRIGVRLHRGAPALPADLHWTLAPRPKLRMSCSTCYLSRCRSSAGRCCPPAVTRSALWANPAAADHAAQRYTPRGLAHRPYLLSLPLLRDNPVARGRGPVPCPDPPRWSIREHGLLARRSGRAWTSP
jgi:hypothetical protein